MAFHSRKILEAEKTGPEKPKPDDCRPRCLDRNPIPKALVISLGIMGAALLLLSYLAMRRYASRRRSPPPPPTPRVSYDSREDFADGLRGPVIDHPVWYIRTTGLPQSVILSIPQFSYKKGDGLIDTCDCSVCLSEFEDGESVRLLPKCSHAFHVACIDTWLGSHTNCPLCRALIVAASGGQSSVVESSSSFISSDREGNGVEIEIRAQEMEPMRRSVSLDFSSAVINVEATKPFWAKRSISLSGPSILV